MATPKLPKPLESEFLVVGEGTGDATLLKHLCHARGISHFQFEDVRGDTKFPVHLAGLMSHTGKKLRGLLVVGDNDDAPMKNSVRSEAT